VSQIVSQKLEQKQNPTNEKSGSDPDLMPIHKGMYYDRRDSTNLGDNPNDKKLKMEKKL